MAESGHFQPIDFGENADFAINWLILTIFPRNRRHVGTGKNRHRRNDDSLPRYSFKIHKDAMDENGKAGVSARSFLNIQKEDKKMIRSLSQAGGRRYIQLKKMVSFGEKFRYP